jgi:hypothetical protein
MDDSLNYVQLTFSIHFINISAYNLASLIQHYLGPISIATYVPMKTIHKILLLVI